MTAWITAGRCGSNVKYQTSYRATDLRHPVAKLQSGNSNQMPFSFICTTLSRFLHCCSSSPPVSKNRMRSSFGGISVMLKQTLFVTILQQLWPQSVILAFLGVEQTTQEEQVTLYHRSVFLYCLNTVIFPFGLSVLPLFLFALQQCHILSSFALTTIPFLSLSPQTSASSRPGQQG